MKVLVTGGTGFVGREVVRQLWSAGHAPRVLARGTRPVESGVELIAGSLSEPEKLPAAFAGIEAVIHLVGIISEVGDQTFERVHRTGTSRVLAAARAAQVSRFIHISALGTRPEAASRYHRSKWAAEELVRQSGLTWTLFRPGLIYGPGDGFVNLFARLSRWSPVLPVMGLGTTLFQPVAVEDVAHCLVGALTTPACAGRGYDICGRERLTLNAMLDAILEVTGRRRLKLRLPLPLARLSAAALELGCAKLLGLAPPLTRDQLLMLQEDNLGDPEPACRMFGFEPAPFRDGLRKFLARA